LGKQFNAFYGNQRELVFGRLTHSMDQRVRKCKRQTFYCKMRCMLKSGGVVGWEGLVGGGGIRADAAEGNRVYVLAEAKLRKNVSVE
jgi:hypothetical protein